MFLTLGKSSKSLSCSSNRKLKVENKTDGLLREIDDVTNTTI